MANFTQIKFNDLGEIMFGSGAGFHSDILRDHANSSIVHQKHPCCDG